MKKHLLIACFLLSNVSNSDTLTTESYTVHIERNCPQENPQCDDVTYEGISNISGKGIKLNGTTWYSRCSDGVSPCRFLGYRFEKENYQYLVHASGLLEVIKDSSKVIVKEEGKWQYGKEIGKERSCDYRLNRTFNPGLGADTYTAAAFYDQAECTGATLILEIKNDQTQKLIYRNSYEFESLNIYQDVETPGIRYANKKMQELTQPVDWPEYRFSHVEDGASCADHWEKINERTDLSEPKKWDLLYRMEEECASALVFDITKSQYTELKNKGVNLFCAERVECNYCYAFNPEALVMIKVAGTCQ